MYYNIAKSVTLPNGVTLVTVVAIGRTRIIRLLRKPTAQTKIVPVMLTVLKYGCASRHNLGSLATVSEEVY